MSHCECRCYYNSVGCLLLDDTDDAYRISKVSDKGQCSLYGESMITMFTEMQICHYLFTTNSSSAIFTQNYHFYSYNFSSTKKWSRQKMEDLKIWQLSCGRLPKTDEMKAIWLPVKRTETTIRSKAQYLMKKVGSFFNFFHCYCKKQKISNAI